MSRDYWNRVLNTLPCTRSSDQALGDSAAWRNRTHVVPLQCGLFLHALVDALVATKPDHDLEDMKIENRKNKDTHCDTRNTEFLENGFYV